MSTKQIIGVAVGFVTIMFTIIASSIGGTWVLSEKINASHAELRVEILEENAKLRVEIEKLRGDIGELDGKLDEFKDSHEREHDLFYGQGDGGNPTPPN